MSEVQLRVLDSRQRDVARGIARINQRTMQKLGVSSGNVIERFSGRKRHRQQVRRMQKPTPFVV